MRTNRIIVILAFLAGLILSSSCTLNVGADGSKSVTVDGAATAKVARAIIVARSAK